MSESPSPPPYSPPYSPVAFAISFVIGWAVIGFGLWTLFGNSLQNHPSYSLSLGLGLNIVHDAIIAPIACVTGYLISRFAPKRMRAQLSWGLFSSAIVVALAYPGLRQFGRNPENSSIQPFNYATSLLAVLAIVWMIVVLSILWTSVRHRRQQS